MNLTRWVLCGVLAGAPALSGGCWVPETQGDEDPGRLADYEMVTVRRVLSAVRILVETESGRQREIRYAGVEGPSAGHALWTAARADNAQLVHGQEVQLIPVEDHDHDDEWAYVVVPNAARRGGLLVQFELARRGMVKPADHPNDRDDEYFDRVILRAEMARREGLGLWAEESGSGGR